MQQNRRHWMLSMAGAIAAPAILRARPAKKRLPIGFSTLGCPKWDWATILSRAAEWGYAAIELRGIQGEMDLTRRPEFSGERWKETQKEVAAHGLKISDLGSSARMHEPDAAKNRQQLDEGKRFIDLAARMKVPYVRVFGDKLVEGEPKQATLDRIIRGLGELGRHARTSGVRVLMETHGDFPDSATVLAIMKGVNLPEVGVLWDTHHTFVAGKEQPAETYRKLRPYIRHTHIKDSVAKGEDIAYVLMGKGRVPVRDIVKALAGGGYRGIYSLEWEKAWHPEIEEPEVAFPQYAEIMGRLLAEAGVA